MSDFDYPRTVQLWPGGRSLTFKGDPDGPNLLVEQKQDDEAIWVTPPPEDRTELKIELLAEIYEHRDILFNDSCLVDEMLKHGYNLPGDLKGEWEFENVVNLYPDPSNWDLEQCKDWLEEKGHDIPSPNPWEMGRAQLVELLESVCIECREDESDEVLRKAVIENIDDETLDGLDDYRDAVRDNGEAEEIFQWFRVESWLAKQLMEIGECVLDNSYGYWWGRGCCGQALICDGVLQRIAQKWVRI